MKLAKVFVAIFILAALVHIYQLSFFEFKNDQLDAINLGKETKAARFIISRGTTSGVGINNPPVFLWFMGALTSLSSNPVTLTAIFAIFNLFALYFALRYFLKSLPDAFAFFAGLLLALTPAFYIYGNIIWAQSLLPVLMVLFQICLYKLITAKVRAYFIYLVILSCIAAGLHMSGFFLFPLLVIIALSYRKVIGPKLLLGALILAVIIFIPYLYHLVAEKEGLKIFGYWNEVLSKKTIYWKVFREQVRITSFDFMRRYFSHDFTNILKKELGLSELIIYPLSAILMPFYACGFLAYLGWLIKGRKLFDANGTAKINYPLPFQIAGFLTLGITLSYLILKIRVPTHYLLILYPSSAIISAYWVFRLNKIFLVRIVFLVAIISTAVCFIASLRFIKKAGGHPNEYGVSYNMLLKIKNEVQNKLPEGARPVYNVKFLSDGKTDVAAVNYALEYGNKIQSGLSAYPVKLTINWNDKMLRYEYVLGK